MAVTEFPTFTRVKANPKWKVVIVQSAWYPELAASLSQSARDVLIQAGIKASNIKNITTPGSYELPLFCKRALKKMKPDGLIAFGIVIRGETHHARLVAEQAAKGIMQVQLEAEKPIIFEVLYVDRIEDARKRSIGLHSKGPQAARALLSCLAEFKEMR